MLNQQKTIAEKKIGKKITSHRPSCNYFEWQQSLINLLNSGFLTNLSVGSSSALSSRGTNLPIYFPDPYGKDTDFWTIDAITSNQSSLQLSSLANNNGFASTFKNLLEQRGIITINYDIDGYNGNESSSNLKTLIELLKHAKRNGALICGVDYLIGQFKQKWNNLYSNLLWSNNIAKEKQFSPSEDIKNEIATYINVFNHSYIRVSSIDIV